MSVDHSKLVQWFEESEDSTRDARILAERDADYYDGKQLTSDEIKSLKKRGQPPVVNNRIKPKIDFMLGAELKTRTDPKAFPRNPNTDGDTANAATDALRYICDTTKFERIRSLCYEDGLKYGSYGTQIVVAEKGDDFSITCVHVPWDRIFADPHSRAKDYSDAKYKGIVIWQDKEDALDSPLYTVKDVASALAAQEGSVTDTYSDKPQNRWFDTARDRVRVVYMEYQKAGDWYFCYFTKSGFLREPTKMPFVNDDETIPSLEFQSLFIDRDGNRYGQIRQYINMQDEINKRRSKGIHLINSRQTMGEKGAVDDVRKAKAELAKPDGHVEFTPGMKFEVLQTNDMSSGNFNMLQEAKNEIDAQGPNAALSGAETRNLSGIAIERLQGGSSTETSIHTDGLRDWECRVYRLMWFCVKKYWTAEKWFRVTDDENAPKYVGLNTPVKIADQLMKQMQESGEEIDPEMEQQIQNDPRAQEMIVTNDVATMDIDIILEDVPDTVSIQSEQFNQLAQIFPNAPPQIQPLMFELLIQSSSLRGKKQITDKLTGKGEKEQKPDPMAEKQKEMAIIMMDIDIEMKKLQLEELKGKITKLETAAVLDLANAEKAEIGNDLAEYQADLEGIRMEREISQPPEQEQPLTM